MRILHTADWHLGRLFHQIHLTDDQAHLLEQFVALAREAKPDCILLAGDIYDRAVPPPEAVELLNDVLARLVLDLGIPVVAIAGNHDSPSRLGFAARVLAERGLHLVGACASHTYRLTLPDADGPVHLYALPYADPPMVRAALGDEEIHDHDAALRAQCAAIQTGHPAGERAVLVAHAFVDGGETAPDSERPLSVGGSGVVAADAFAGFAYVALGHLHCPQSVTPRIHYPGSLMPYAFSEAAHPKAVTLVELDGHGEVHLESIRLTPRRAIRRVEGFLRELLDDPDAIGGSRDDYLEVVLLDDGAILDAMGQLRTVFPNVLHLERPALTAALAAATPGGDHRGRALVELFADFYEQVTEGPWEDAVRDEFLQIVEAHAREEREVSRVG